MNASATMVDAGTRVILQHARTHSVAVYASAHWLKVCNLKVMDTPTVKPKD
jgi:hypothetical protein